MSQPENKTEDAPIVVHCAACGAGIRAGEPAGQAVLPIGFDFAGRLIAERLRICGHCVALAETSEADAQSVKNAVLVRYHGSPDAVFVPEEYKGGLH